MEQIWPQDCRLDDEGMLWIGGCPVRALADRFGTPLYVFDEATLRSSARAYKSALAHHYPATAQVAYASKAYLCTAIAQLFAEEGLDLDVVSGGELYVALRAGFPPERIHFHGNNKSREELRQALEAGIGRIVVDNFHELAMLTEFVGIQDSRFKIQDSRFHIPHPIPIWLRLVPGISAHTHHHIRTGQEDTKFGFSIASGDAARAVAQALATPGLTLVGLHCHIGSQIYEPEALAAAAERLIAFAAEMRDRYGFALRELSPGGGWGVPMTETDPPAPVESYVAAVSAAVVTACQRHGLPLPHLVLEPGRSLVARAGVALYRVGARKEIPGVRTYVSVDGGMADNIRPALYGAKYCGLRAARGEPRSTQYAVRNTQYETVTIAGKFCESGDVLIRDIELPRLEPGDLLAIPMAGAYTLAMASNYNLVPRPAVVLVNDGQARLIQRRETYDDLVARDIPLDEQPGDWGQPGDWKSQLPLQRRPAPPDPQSTTVDFATVAAVSTAGPQPDPPDPQSTTMDFATVAAVSTAGPQPDPPDPQSTTVDFATVAAVSTAGPQPRLRPFTKYHAHGNDYLVLDPADWPDPPDAEAIRRICDRHRGVGADGVLWGPTAPPTPLLRGERSKDSPFPGREGGQGGRSLPGWDRSSGGGFALRLFNPDGGEFEISGNGLRIFARYLWDQGLPAGPHFTIETPAGPVVAHVLDARGERISLEMGRLSFRGDEIGLTGPAREVIEEEIEIAGQRLRITAVSIGNPHCVVFVENIPFQVPQGPEGLVHLAQTLGPELERLPLYPHRTNVQFAEVVDRHTLRMAIWERGAGYTLASGTSSCAAAGAAIRTGRCLNPVTVRMPGGEMLVEVSADWSVRLTGAVAFVCRGECAVM